ncbi:MAG: hypothetical protein ACRDKT_05030 [Actinomycetota bacterium]
MDNDKIDGGKDGAAGDLVTYLTAAKTSSITVNLLRGFARGRGEDTLGDVENIWTDYGADHIVGNHKPNAVYSAEGNDTIVGNGGDDCLAPGGSENEIYGGEGFDFFSTRHYYNCLKEPYDFGLVEGVVFGGMTVDLADGRADDGDATSILHSIEGAFGYATETDHLWGDDSTNHLYGGGATDMLHGRGGDDLLDGGGNYDSLDGGDGNDTCINGEANVACEDSRRR